MYSMWALLLYVLCVVHVHTPHLSVGPYPHPDSALLPSLWQHEVETDWWSARKTKSLVLALVL